MQPGSLKTSHNQLLDTFLERLKWFPGYRGANLLARILLKSIYFIYLSLLVIVTTCSSSSSSPQATVFARVVGEPSHEQSAYGYSTVG